MRLKRKFEGESFFNMSSVRHVKHVTVKSNSRWKKNSPFHISYGDFTVDKALLVHIWQYGDFLATKMWQSKRWFIFHCSEEYHRSYSTSTKFERNMSTVVSRTYFSFLKLIILDFYSSHLAEMRKPCSSHISSSKKTSPFLFPSILH